MRDKREPTRSNAEAVDDEDEVLADRLPKVLASRLRTARTAAGLAQGAVADAMADRGFSWRQTTVAKSEAADRPVLFAEVAALAQIFRRPIDYFLYPGTELDALIDAAKANLEEVASEISEAERQLESLRQEERIFRSTVELATAIARYRITSDSGPLMHDLRDLLGRWGPDLLRLRAPFEALGVSTDQVAEAAYEGMRDVAQVEMDYYDSLTVEELQTETTGENLSALSDFLKGNKVPKEYFDVLQRSPGWVDFVTPRLTDLLIEAINVQHHLNY